MNDKPQSRRLTRRNVGRFAVIFSGALAVSAIILRPRKQKAPFIQKSNPPGIYGAEPSGVLYSPFSLNIEPMERLILINIAEDPDRLYEVLEPQVFNDSVTGKGFRLLAWRVDGRVDVYQQPGLHLNPKTFDIAGKGLGDVVERPFEGARFDVNSPGVDVYFSFEDKEGRRVEVTVREKGPKPIKPFAFLAPLGSGAANPPALPLLILHEFYFVRRANTEFDVEIAGVSHRPDTLPFIIDGSRIYFTRYAADPFIVLWNPAYQGHLSPLTPTGAGEAHDQSVTYELVSNDGHYEIKRMRAASQRHEINIDFSPPVPDIVSLRDGASVAGKFRITADESAGTVSGEYLVERREQEVIVKLHPSEGWQPNEGKWSLKFLYSVVPLFKTWPKTYEWTAKIELAGDKQPLMNSRWQRTS